MTSNNVRERFVKWFDEHGLFCLALFLLIFIPLYPKIPLLEAIPGYLVRVRLEDILVGIVGIVFLIQVIRGKAILWTQYTVWISFYAVLGLLSLIFAVFVLQSIPLQPLHVGKSLLHFIRYIEYFSLFAYMYAGVKNHKHIKIALIGITLTVVLVVAYGFGQKYMGWPVWSTMNREFSKGQALQLSSLARVHSTFGGHYDLAAFLVIALPLLFALLLWTKNRLVQFGLLVVQFGGVLMVIASASNISFLGYLVGVGLVTLLSLKQRFGLFKAFLVSGGLFVGGATLLLTLVMIINPSAINKIKKLVESSGKTSVPIDVVGRPLNETWSENARKYGLSMGIRLDTLWPQALSGLTSNPLLGKGYATLNKQGNNEFTEADSTDNNYLRVLGETGLLGFLTFFGLLVFLLKSLTFHPAKHSSLAVPLAIGFWGSTVGLLTNALIIDVFAASKVAFTFWAVAGLVTKTQLIVGQTATNQLNKAHLQQWLMIARRYMSYVISIVLLILLAHKQPFSDRSLVQNMDLSPDTLHNVVFAHCLATQHQWQECISNNSNLRPWEYAYSLYLTPWYLISHHPSMFYFGNIVLILIGFTLFYLLLKKWRVMGWMQLLVLLIVATSPMAYTLPTKPIALNLLLPMCVGMLFLFPRDFIHKKSLMISFPTSKRVWWLIPFGYMLIVLSQLNLFQVILMNYRDQYRPWRYQAVRRANTFIPNNDISPILITAVNSDYFQLFGTGEYLVSDLSLNKLTNYQTILQTRPEVFLTNADINRSAEAQKAFEALKQNYGIQLREIDCNHQCNYYRLFPENTPLSNQPHPINNPRLEVGSGQPLRVLIASQRFDTSMAKSKFTTITAADQLKKISDLHQPNWFILMGDGQDKQTPLTETLFRSNFANVVSFPISYLPGNQDVSSPKTLLSEPRLFQRDKTIFIIYPTDVDGTVAPSMRLFLFNALLQLDKHPEVTNVFVLTHRSNWLAANSDNVAWIDDLLTIPLNNIDPFLRDEFLPALQKFDNKHFYLISGDLRPLSHPSVLYEITDGGKITFISSSINQTANDAFLELEISPEGEVRIKAYGLDEITIPLKTFNLEYWKQEIEANQ